MKTTWTALLLMAALLWACNKPADPELSCRITGSVNPVLQEYLAFTYAEFLDSTKIDQNGDFTFEVPVSEAGFGMLIYNNSLVELYVEQGKTLNVKINSLSFPDKLEFDSDLGPVNHYSQLARKLDKQTDIANETLYSKEPGPFMIFSDSIRDIKNKLLQEYVDKYPEIDSSFVIKRRADILYSWASQRLVYPGYYALIKKQIPLLPDQYHLGYLEQLELNNSDFLISQMYKTFLENYLDYKEAVFLDKHPDVEKVRFPGSVARFRVIHEEFTNEEIKNFLLYRAMGDHLDNFGIDNIESFITNFQVSCTNEDYKTEIENKISVAEKLARGQVAPELEFENKAGEKVKLSDLKGKLLYLNFWASWSEWSIQEFGYWERLRSYFDGYEIQFISVSMDFARDRNKWEYILDKQKLGGLQLIKDPKSNAFQDQYLINELPRYMLIDAEGKIISAHAPRPSENMESVLKKLLRN